MGIMFEGTVTTGKNAFYTSGKIPKECIEGSRDSADSKEFVDPQCEPFANVDPMELEGTSLSRAGPAVNKGNDVIVESRSVSTRTLFASIAATEVQAIVDMVLSLPGMQSGDRLAVFSSLFFMGNQEARIMFAALSPQNNFWLKWLEIQYQMHPEFHL
nr:hypothetical protein CFP56_65830 [Quercus suber]